MQAYGQGFARVYNARWSGYAKQVAPVILDFYAATPIAQTNKSVLDLCCGTGHLGIHFLENGYTAVGIDLSEHMLKYARENAAQYVESGKARFVQADAGDFTLEERFGLVVSVYDSLNHLEDEQALKGCFRCVYGVCDGYFVFDLNTRLGLKRWNSIQVQEFSDDEVVITRGIYDGQGDKAWTRITGFVGRGDGLFERIDETVFNTVFSVDRVNQMLLEVGWKEVHFARLRDLRTPLAEPEDEGRVFAVARK